MATDRAILSRSIVTCLIVGTLLNVINHGDRLLRGEFNATLAWRVGLTFLVPFLVATTSGVAAMRGRADRRLASAQRPASAALQEVELDAESRAAVER